MTVVVTALLVVAAAALVEGGTPAWPLHLGRAALMHGAMSPSHTPPASRSEAPAAAAVRRIAVVGDSVTTGSTCDCTTFPDLLAEGLQDRFGKAVHVDNDGVDGTTTDEVLTSVHDDATTRADLHRADLVLVTIGANDFVDLLGREPGVDDPCTESCYRPRTRRTAAKVADLVGRIHALAPDARILVTDYWNVSRDGRDVPPATIAVNREITRSFNSELAQALRDTPADVVDLYEPFITATHGDPTRLLLADGDHPSAEGHRVIARTLLHSLGL